MGVVIAPIGARAINAPKALSGLFLKKPDDGSAEYVTNGTFEVNILGWVDSDLGTGSTLSRDTGEHHSGSASLKVVTPGVESQQGAVTFIDPFTPNTDYTARCWVKGSGGGVLLGVSYFNSGDVITDGGSTDVPALSGAWQEIVVNGTTDGTTDHIGVYIITDDVYAMTFYIDDVSLVPA